MDTATSEGDAADPVARMLLRPSADDASLTFDQLLYRMLMDYHTTGDGYVEVVRNGSGRVAELYHVPARTMRVGAERGTFWQVKPTRRVAFSAFGHGPREGTTRGKRSEIVHLKEYDVPRRAG